MNRLARVQLRDAVAVVEAIWLRLPRPRLSGEQFQPPPGRLRVERVLWGRAPAFIIVPLAPACPTGEQVGDRGLMVLYADRVPSWFVVGLLGEAIRRVIWADR
jgi:hypothetical protein